MRPQGLRSACACCFCGVEVLKARFPQLMTVTISYPTLSRIFLNGRTLLGTALKPTNLLTEQASLPLTNIQLPVRAWGWFCFWQMSYLAVKPLIFWQAIHCPPNAHSVSSPSLGTLCTLPSHLLYYLLSISTLTPILALSLTASSQLTNTFRFPPSQKVPFLTCLFSLILSFSF